MTSKLAIGSVQFGLDYGISNREGITSFQEVKKILDIAFEENIDLIDTASSYDKSELVLGETKLSNKFKIVTKIRDLGNEKNQDISKIIQEEFKRSLKFLKTKKIYGLLLHNANNLSSEFADNIWNEFKKLKKIGLVDKIGVSVYDAKQIDFIIKNFEIDLIQLPLSIYDQSLFLNGYIKKLKDLRIEIHARSIFLQGLILQNSDSLKDFFLPIKKHHQQFLDAIKNIKAKPLDACLGFVKKTEIDYAVVGVNNSNQFNEIIKSFKMDLPNIDLTKFALDNPLFTNPTNWKINK